MSKQKLEWTTVKRHLGGLIGHSFNPRIASDKFKQNLTRLLKKFGLVEIPAIDVDGTVVAGHQRIAILLALHGPDYVIDVRIPNRPLTREERKEYLLASNRAHADWDFDSLSEHYSDIETLLAAGFDDIDIGLINDNLTIEEDEFRTEDEIKKNKNTSVQPGDLYQLGPSRILCADSTDPTAIKKLMSGKRATAILTDPPYNIGLSYDRGIGGKSSYGGHVDDSKSNSEYEKLLRKALENGLSACEKDAHVFVYHDPRYTWLLQKIYQELGVAYRRTCLWVKNNSTPTPQSAFNRQYEPCLYGVIGKPYLSKRETNFSEIMNREIAPSGNKTVDDVYDVFDLWLARRVTGGYTHPTEKPASLHERALRRCTRPGEIVLDLFSGSASLLAACHFLKRSAYMVEREPLFVELALRRYEKLTGKKARKIN